MTAAPTEPENGRPGIGRAARSDAAPCALHRFAIQSRALSGRRRPPRHHAGSIGLLLGITRQVANQSLKALQKDGGVTVVDMERLRNYGA